MDGTEPVALAGALLTVLGLVVVAPDAPGRLLGAVVRRAERLRRRKPPAQHVLATSVSLWAQGSAPTLTQGPRPDAGVEERVGLLERDVRALREQVGEQRVALANDLAAHGQRVGELEDRLAQLSEEHSAVVTKSERIHTVGFPIAAVGAFASGAPFLFLGPWWWGPYGVVFVLAVWSLWRYRSEVCRGWRDGRAHGLGA